MFELAKTTARGLASSGACGPVVTLPRLIDDAGSKAQRRFIDFFLAKIRNSNTRAAYGHATGRFLAWCDAKA